MNRLASLVRRKSFAPLALLPLLVACGGHAEVVAGSPTSQGDAAPPSAPPPSHIYVADSYYQVGKLIEVDDMTGAGWASWTAGGSPLPALCGVALDARGRVYVGGANQGVLRLDDISGAGLVTYSPSPSAQVGAVAVDASGRIYGVDGNVLFRVDDMSGAGLTTLGTRAGGSGAEQLNISNGAAGIAVSASGKILVADSGNSRVVETNDMNGAGWSTWTMPVAPGYQSTLPYGVAYDGAERIYVVDLESSTLYRMNSIKGDGLVSFSQDGLIQMSHVFVHSSGRIYMTMLNATERIAVMNDMTGAGLVTLGSAGDGKGQFGNPCGIVAR
jgi:hypothetical protein